MTETAKETQAAISPDGKYVLGVLDENGLESLWLRNIATGSDTRVIAPAAVIYQDLAFSSDANYIYFRQSQSILPDAFNLYRAPVLGGTPQLIVKDIDSNTGFSAAGNRFVFFRFNDPDVGNYRLISVNPDGSDEKVLPIAAIPSNALAVLAWSPDGRRVAYPVTLSGKVLSAIDLFDLGSGKTLRLATFADKRVNRLVWLPDGAGLLVVYAQGLVGKNQIGFVSYPQGKFRPITQDTNSYATVAVSADGQTVATAQRKSIYRLYLLPATAPLPLPPPLPCHPGTKTSLPLNWPATRLFISAKRTDSSASRWTARRGLR